MIVEKRQSPKEAPLFSARFPTQAGAESNKSLRFDTDQGSNVLHLRSITCAIDQINSH
jgi:hypothetical protein